MRAREMIARLARLPKMRTEQKIPDFSLLSPEKQDRARELLDLIIASGDGRSIDLYNEFKELTHALPLLGPADPQQGPVIEVPGELYHYWQWQQPISNWRSLNFHKLGKVETLRFVALCQRYGFENGVDIRAQMLPLNGWQPKDRAELQEILDVAAT
jgi:hypothetical protein